MTREWKELVPTRDVLIQRVRTIPKTAEQLKHTILAEGEVTGHCHRIKESGQSTYETENREITGPKARKSAGVR